MSLAIGEGTPTHGAKSRDLGEAYGFFEPNPEECEFNMREAPGNHRATDEESGLRTASRRRSESLSRTERMIVGVLALIWVPGLLALSDVWSTVEYASHGYLIPSALYGSASNFVGNPRDR